MHSTPVAILSLGAFDSIRRPHSSGKTVDGSVVLYRNDANRRDWIVVLDGKIAQSLASLIENPSDWASKESVCQQLVHIQPTRKQGGYRYPVHVL